MFLFLLPIYPIYYNTNMCHQNMCVHYEQNMKSEEFMLNKRIKYFMWWNGPVYYDCWGILTEAMRKEGYIGKKIHSWFLKCRKPNIQAKAWDILVNQNEWQRHVALITKDYKNGSVQILDYVAKNTAASYRKHSFYNNIFTLDKECLLSLKSYEPL